MEDIGSMSVTADMGRTASTGSIHNLAPIKSRAPERPPLTLALSARSSAPCRFDCGDCDNLHLPPRLERGFSGCRVGTGYCVPQRPRGDLPGQAPSVFPPSARALGAAVVDDCVPVTVRL